MTSVQQAINHVRATLAGDDEGRARVMGWLGQHINEEDTRNYIVGLEAPELLCLADDFSSAPASLHKSGAPLAGICCMISGGALLIMAIAFSASFDTVIAMSGQVSSLYAPPQDSDAWKDWISNDRGDSPDKFYVFYFMNITNPDGVLKHGQYPTVAEVGPFVYWAHETKLDPTMDTTEKTVTFLQHERYSLHLDPVHFTNDDGTVDEIVSLDPADVTVYQWNVPLFSAITQIMNNPYNRSSNVLLNEVCNMAPYNGSFMYCVDDQLPQFAQIPGLNLSKTLSGYGQGLVCEKTVEQWLGMNNEDAIIDETIFAINTYMLEYPNTTDAKFAYFYNASTETDAEARMVRKPWTLSWDASDPGASQRVRKFAGQSKFKSVKEMNTHADFQSYELSFDTDFVGWGKPLDVAGSDYVVQATHPNKRDTDDINIWIDMFVAPVPFQYAGDKTLKGVDVSRYDISRKFYDATPENVEMYFSTVNGMRNITQVKQYTPLFISAPHFAGYPDLASRFPVHGMPAVDTHRDHAHIHLERTTGLIVSANVAFQTNLYVEDSRLLNFAHTSVDDFNIKSTVFPIFSTEQRQQLTDAQAKQLKQIQMLKTAVALLLGLSSFVALVAGICLAARTVSRPAGRRARAPQRVTMHNTAVNL